MFYCILIISKYYICEILYYWILNNAFRMILPVFTWILYGREESFGTLSIVNTDTLPVITHLLVMMFNGRPGQNLYLKLDRYISYGIRIRTIIIFGAVFLIYYAICSCQRLRVWLWLDMQNMNFSTAI